MRFAFLLPVFVALGTAAFILVEGGGPATRGSGAHGVGAPAGDAAPVRSGGGIELVTGISAYTDPELAFDMAIPAGWTPIAVVDDAPAGPGADLAQAAHVVGFEAPRDGPDDRFADYVMIEILPDRDSGLFLTDGSRTEPVRIDGVAGSRDSLVIEGHEVDGVRLDLLVHQAEIRGPGWTIGFYAIGEARNAALVADAFELMIRTFHLPGPPFRVA